MTIGEITYNLMKRLGMSSDDFIFSEYSIYLDLKDARNELIKQEIEKGRLLDSASYQSLKVTLQEEYLDEGAKYGVKCFKSTTDIPTFIDAKNGPLVFGIYTSYGERIIPVKTVEEYFVNTRRRTFNTSNGSVRSLIRNKRLLIFGLDPLISDFYVTADGFYEDPELVEMANQSNEKEGICPSMQELDFHCPGYILRRVQTMAYEMSAKRLSIPTDIENDGKDQFTP